MNEQEKIAFGGLLAGLAGKAAMGAAKLPGNMALGTLRAVAKAPMAAGLGLAFLPGIGPLSHETQTPGMKKIRLQNQRAYQNMRNPRTITGKIKGPFNFMGGNMRPVINSSLLTKQSSVRPSDDDIRKVLAIHRSLEKTAAPAWAGRAGSYLKTLVNDPIVKYTAALTLLGSVSAAASTTLQYGMGKAMMSARKTSMPKEYKKMIKSDPSIKELPRHKEMFKVLHRASPYVASEPIIASATVRNMLDYETLDERRLQSLLMTEKLRQETEMPFFRQGQGLKVSMGDPGRVEGSHFSGMPT